MSDIEYSDLDEYKEQSETDDDEEETGFENEDSDDKDEDDNEDDEDDSLDEDDDFTEEIISDKLSEKITLNFLTKYEKTKLIGIRAQQINKGAQPMIDISDIVPLTPINIAKEELKQRKIPFIINRHLPGGKTEKWKISKLVNLNN